MGINIHSLTPSQAQSYYYDYNNGNKEGLSEAEYASLCTKFRSYIAVWEQDENNYTATLSPEERLDFDADDAGLGFNTQTAQGSNNLGVSTGASVVALTSAAGASFTKFAGAEAARLAAEEAFFKATEEAMKEGASEAAKEAATEAAKNLATKQAEEAAAKEAAKKAAKVESISLLVTAALEAASAIWYATNTPNKDAAEACKTAQDELYVEQAVLADQVLEMEEMQEEMAVLQEEAIAVNEQGQADITSMEGLYNYYYMKYQNGKATPQEVAILNSLSVQMSTKQTDTTAATTGINGEIAAVGENYEVITSNIDTTNSFTEYVSEIDTATKTAALVQGSILTLSCAAATVTATKCIARATSLSASLIGAAAAVMYYAAAALSAGAALTFGKLAYDQFTSIRSTAEDTRDIRLDTQGLSAETTEFQEVSTEFWEETVEATSIDNLFTLTPTYANQTLTTSGAQSTSTTATTGSNTTEGSTNTSSTTTTNSNPFASGDDEKDKDV